ncbi:DeoR/GlpR family DNA-binding transcription regulator [Lactiplantibacillus plantarum]|uniref:DeoR/GlpR family DNA-binding transcription regulator n=2 Tax=Lactiplantibacillus plantarum TaxID=1590 RepID=UPI0021A3CD30|nr:DeoR/GlpR family DNA-binding transcription regulator [Lactiplantibacillus plantarum]MDB7775635.1 DeoR/GlpR family DNA-binding transcription regulator [Lactiplantibacillus plantarum]
MEGNMVSRDDLVLHILKILNKHPRISVKRLIELTGESVSTMRRDLIVLEQSGKVKRTFGMVSLLENTNIEFASPFRYRTHVEEKKVICRLLARKVIKDNQALFIDPSTTTAYLPNYLSERQNVKVITDNLQFAIAANQMTNLNLFLTGGSLRPNSNSLLGNHTIQDIAMFRPQLAIVSCSTLDNTGAYIADMDQADVKIAMMKSARESILVADHTKFQSVNSDYIRLASFPAWSTIVTDRAPKDQFLKHMAALGVKVIYPGSK